MGSLFHDAWRGATHLAGEAWHGFTEVANNPIAGALFPAFGVYQSAKWVVDKVGWPTIASVAVSVAVFIGISVATGGLADLGLLAAGLTLVGASVISGLAGQLTYDGLTHRRPGWDLAVAAGLSVALLPLGPLVRSVAGKVLAPIVEKGAATAFGRLVGGEASQAAARVTARSSLRQWAVQALERGAQEQGPAAAENAAHISRLVGMAKQDPAALRVLGIDPNAAEIGILYSDLGKNPEFLEPYATEMFGDAQGLNRFKGFLLHEEPGIAALRQRGAELGLSDAEIERYVGAIRGHNGPSVGWWGENWNKFIASMPEDARSPLVGKPYPLPATPEAAFHAALDRVDQGGLTWASEGWVGGPKKIMLDNLGMKQSLETAARGALEGNPAGTLEQLATLRAAHPSVFELPVVKDGIARVEATPSLLEHVQFTKGGTEAIIHAPEGDFVATDFKSFWEGMSRIPPGTPSAVPLAIGGPAVTSGIDGALGAVR